MNGSPPDSSGLAGLIAVFVVVFLATIPIWGTLLCGVIGTITERKHYESIHAREKASAGVPVIPSPVSNSELQVTAAHMVTGSMVVAPDSFRRFLARIRNFFGGRLRSYESLLDRARREAVLRMKEQAPDANAIVNFRMETSKIGGVQKKQGIVAIEVLAYGTALTYGGVSPGPSQSPPPLS